MNERANTDDWAAVNTSDGLTFVRRRGTAWTRRCLGCGKQGAAWAVYYRKLEGYCEPCMEGLRVLDVLAA